MNIRSMNINDIDKIIDIENKLYKSPWTKKAYLEEINKNEYAKYFVLEDDNNLIGYIGFWLVSNYATITKVSIIPQAQGKHYSIYLMDYMFDYLNNNDCELVDLEVRVSNIKAINLYNKYEFIQAGIRKKYYSDGEDALLMIRKLKDGGEETYEKIHISA